MFVSARLLLPVAAAILFFGCSPEKRNIQIVRLGEKIQTGSLIYNAFDTQWLPNLGEGPSARTPAKRFFLIKLSIVNSGKADANVPTLMLVDDAGETYSELTSGEGVPNWMGVVRRIHPADSETGEIAFDVEPKRYRLRVPDENDDQFAYIDIPLNFGTTNTPNLPPPAAPSK